MSKPETKEEAKIVGEKEKSFKGHPDKHEYSVKEELPSGMKKPVDKEDAPSKMGGVHKSGDAHIGNAGMGHARKHLERETERGEHMAHVGGHKAYQHSGHTAKD